MSAAHLTRNQNGVLIMGLDVNSERLTYSLESLPELLGKGDRFVLVNALANAMGDHVDRHRRNGETDGEYAARIIRTLAGVKVERAA